MEISNNITLPVSYSQEEFRNSVVGCINLFVDFMGFCDKESGCVISLDEVGSALSFLLMLNKAELNQKN